MVNKSVLTRSNTQRYINVYPAHLNALKRKLQKKLELLPIKEQSDLINNTLLVRNVLLVLLVFLSYCSVHSWYYSHFLLYSNRRAVAFRQKAAIKLGAKYFLRKVPTMRELRILPTIMANDNNLIPYDKLTESEQRELVRKGGIASGIARRERKQLKDRLLILADGEITNAKGETAAREDIISLQLVNKAIKGDLKAIRLYAQLTGQLVDQLSVNAELSARRAPIFKDLPHPDND